GGRLLDPFAGSGTALFTASDQGLDALGIELLPCSAEIIEVRQLARQCDQAELAQALRDFRARQPWESAGASLPFTHLAITQGAFPANNEALLCRYLWECDQLGNRLVGRVCRFAAVCILESISYTRKDGQYLRWDARSGKKVAKTFDKGAIRDFTT